MFSPRDRCTKCQIRGSSSARSKLKGPPGATALLKSSTCAHFALYFSRLERPSQRNCSVPRSPATTSASPFPTSTKSGVHLTGDWGPVLRGIGRRPRRDVPEEPHRTLECAALGNSGPRPGNFSRFPVQGPVFMSRSKPSPASGEKWASRWALTVTCDDEHVLELAADPSRLRRAGVQDILPSVEAPWGVPLRRQFYLTLVSRLPRMLGIIVRNRP